MLHPRALALLVLSVAAVTSAMAGGADRLAGKAVPVEVQAKGDGFALIRDGAPYFIKGVGGTRHLELLADCGGNSIRTWTVGDRTQDILDQAERLGLTVTLGIWLERVGTGMDYGDKQALARQEQRVRSAVERFKDHPALLMWALGNEGEAEGHDARYYQQLERLCAAVRTLDRAHPTMTVIAELGEGGRKVKDLGRHAPSIDVIGINSYGSIDSVPRRYRKAGGARPYVVTEHGPRGHWESPRTAWGTPIEETPAEKAARYRAGHNAAVDGQDLCLGAYAFYWGQKQETTATWYGMLLEDGTRLAPVDALSEIWTGEKPRNRVPRIQELSVDRTQCEPGARLRATLDANDPDGDRIRVEWVLRKASAGDGTYGDKEDRLQDLPKAVLSSKRRSAKLRMPDEPGPYRLFAYVRDGKGGAAVHNVPLLVAQ